MNKIIHPTESEELMAYLDGELSPDRAAATAAHLNECAECQALVVELRGVSQTLHKWEVPGPGPQIPASIASALAERSAGRRVPSLQAPKRRYLRWPTLGWGAGLAAVSALIIFAVLSPNLLRVRKMARPQRMEVENLIAPARPVPDGRASDKAALSTYQKSAPVNEESANIGGASEAARLTIGPMIIRMAALSLTTKDFDKARASLEEILRKHRGYVGELKVGGASGSGRTLTGTLRVPADQLDATLADLKTLGRVESESQGGQDVTPQYVDLQARLSNARNTEKRLTDLLSQRTGKLSDVLEVEQEVDRVRGEIEQMEAERKNMANQVSFATLTVTISEDYKAQLEVVPPSTTTRLSNAAVEGYRSMVDGIVDVMLFLLSNGPSLLLWAALLFLPARFAWKAMRRHGAH
jgi:hypothetical protein